MTGYTRTQNVDIANTMQVPVRARQVLDIHDLWTAFTDPDVQEQWLSDPATLIVGGGSNILFVSDSVKKVVRITAHAYGFEDEGDTVLVHADAGMGLDECVRWTARQGWYGIERLAEIPGTVGAAPIQNVGAYGVQLSDVLESVEVWDRHERKLTRWTAAECGLSYRHSRFKEEPDRWLVLRVWLRLAKHRPSDWPPLDYPGVRAVAEEFAKKGEMDLKSLTPLDLAEIITRVRRQKLPDWRSRAIGSLGSFFQNPIVERSNVDRLLAEWPDMPRYPQEDESLVKLSAGWLIERSGWRGRSEGAAGVYERHALVLVNLGGASGAALWKLAQDVQADVLEKFGVRLKPEPLVYVDY